MKKLEEFILKATNYLFQESIETEENNRKKIIEFCLKHGLDEKFLKLVEENHKWLELANCKKVKYLVDVPDKNVLEKTSKDYVADISLQMFEAANPVPVIKITNSENIL